MYFHVFKSCTLWFQCMPLRRVIRTRAPMPASLTVQGMHVWLMSSQLAGFTTPKK